MDNEEFFDIDSDWLEPIDMYGLKEDEDYILRFDRNINDYGECSICLE